MYIKPTVVYTTVRSKAVFPVLLLLCVHYENTPIQIYRKFHLQKLKIFR